MSVFETIKKLRSFKTATDRAIPRKKMGRILEAGRDTPSPGNVQSLEFIVVEDERNKRMLADATGDGRVEEAPLAVIIISDVDRMARHVSDDPLPLSSAEAACSAQNMRLVAQEEGVSSCWITGFDGNMVADQFRIPEGKLPIGVIAFCYASQEYEKEDRFGMNSVLFYDEYDNQIGSQFDQFEWEGLLEERDNLERRTERFIEKVRRKLNSIL